MVAMHGLACACVYIHYCSHGIPRRRSKAQALVITGVLVIIKVVQQDTVDLAAFCVRIMLMWAKKQIKSPAVACTEYSRLG